MSDTTLTLAFDSRKHRWTLTAMDGRLAVTAPLRGADDPEDFAEAKREARKILDYSPRWKVSTHAIDGTEVGRVTTPKSDVLPKTWKAF